MQAMDDAKRIVTELLAKLAELDGKVANYRQDINAEFDRYSAAILKDVPEHVSTEVSRVIAESMPNYPMLNGPSRNPVESPAESPIESPTALPERGAWSGRKSPPPILYHTSGTPKDGPRSPHEREKEFQGVFTPSYLPLLDGSDRSPHSPTASPPPASPTTLGPSPAFAPSLNTILSVDETLEPQSGDDVPRPTPIRRQTDGTVSSVESSGSDTKARRSALRRSSSSAKGSPRRVRFDVQGTEVLPTCSPQATGSPRVCLGEAEVPTSAIVDDSPAYAGPSLLDVEGEEDSLPRPKKVSSTQALRALTRSPLEEGTVWRVVNPDTEDTPRMNGLDQVAPPVMSSPSSAATATAPTSSPAHARIQIPKSQKDDIVPASDELEKDDDKDGSEEEEFLSMRPKTSKKSPSPATRSPAAGSPRVTAADVSSRVAHEPVNMPPAARVLPRSNILGGKDKTSDKDAEDAFFDFDGDETLLGASSQPRNTEKYLSEGQEDELEAERDNKSPPSLSAHATSLYTTLPTRTIPGSVDDKPVAPTSARFLQGSVGSYKGHTLRMSTIRNPKVQEDAAAMGDLTSLVGSVDDASRFDTALGSFRASLTNTFSLEPRSFSERMALEEVMEKRRQ